jgi:hypothetical protein
MRDPTGPILSKPRPEGLQVLLLAPLHDVQEFRSPGAFQGADHGPVGLALSDPDLVEPQDGNSVQRPFRLDLLQPSLVDLLDRPAMKSHEDPDRLVGHDLAQLVDQSPKRGCHMRTSKVYEVQGLRPDSAIGTINPIAPESHEGDPLPPQQVPDFLNVAVVSRKPRPPASTALMGSANPLKGHHHPAVGRLSLDQKVNNPEIWKIQKRRDKVVRHPMSPPYCHLAVNHTELSYPSSGASFYPHFLVKSQI